MARMPPLRLALKATGGSPSVTTVTTSGRLDRHAIGLSRTGEALASTGTPGSAPAINWDKTGTLTLNRMTVVQMAIAGARFAIDGKGYSTAGAAVGSVSPCLWCLLDRDGRPATPTRRALPGPYPVMDKDAA